MHAPVSGMGTGDNLQRCSFSHIKASPPAGMQGFWSAQRRQQNSIPFKEGGNWWGGEWLEVRVSVGWSVRGWDLVMEGGYILLYFVCVCVCVCVLQFWSHDLKESQQCLLHAIHILFLHGYHIWCAVCTSVHVYVCVFNEQHALSCCLMCSV